MKQDAVRTNPGDLKGPLLYGSSNGMFCLHSTLADLFEQIDLITRRALNELTNIKLFYSTTENGTQIHLHHHQNIFIIV
jgi:hypothetical protein